MKRHIHRDNLKKNLNKIIELAEDSYDFSNMLNSSIKNLLLFLPQGKENYSVENPKIGHIYLTRTNSEKGPGTSAIEYSPSNIAKNFVKYVQFRIGNINLRDKSYRLKEPRTDIEKTVIADTKLIMEMLGLSENK